MTILILIGGNPGTGKTTISEKVARNLRAAWMDNQYLDPMMDHALLLAGAGPQQYDTPHYKQLRPVLYAAAKNIVTAQLHTGLPTIWSAPMQSEFVKNDDRFLTEMGHIAAQAQAKFLPVWLWAPEDVTKQRLITRKEDKDKNKIDNWPDYASQIHFGPIVDTRVRHLQALSIPVLNIENPDADADLAVNKIVETSRELLAR
ncbi:MAG: hypothetical protein EYC62_03915 [Alphaproteobacteria bacterium]|nr:MAG: hypothetical protein EYC62_03915 [Alphaproteobacteria bacterium]